MYPDCAQEESRKHHKNNITPEKFFSIVNEKFGDVLDFSETIFEGMEDKDGNAKYVTVIIKRLGKELKGKLEHYYIWT